MFTEAFTFAKQVNGVDVAFVCKLCPERTVKPLETGY